MLGMETTANLENYNKLLARLAEIGHISQAGAVLGWDQQCYMPHGGAEARANQLAVLGKIAHEMEVSDETRRLLEGAEAETASLDADSDPVLAVKVARRDFDKSAKLPTSLVEELSRATALAHETWVEAREKSDWALFAPTLEKLLELTRQQAEYLGYEEHIYDALLNQYETGMKTRDVERVFDELRPGLVELVQYIAASPKIDDSCLKRGFAEDKQKAFGEKVIKLLGYDFTRGRQDKAVHPFCTSFTRNDVRITTRFEEDWLPAALMGTIHETGHALYEQGLDPKDDNSPLGGAVSLGVHESQSRLWENVIGRSRSFWNIFYKDLQATFPEQLGDVDPETFYRAINRVEPSFIRVEADEVTYNLHIMIRFELEKKMLDGSLKVADVPKVWNETMQEYLGVTPPTDALGCLQDVHWSFAGFGYFPTYSLGTLLASQLYEKATADNPQIVTDLEKGEYMSLLSWLRTNIHQPGRRYLPAELVERVCGEPAQSRSYLKYLNDKFRGIYTS